MGDKRNPPSVLQDWRGEQLLLWGRHKALPVLYSKEKKKKTFIYLKERKLCRILKFKWKPAVARDKGNKIYNILCQWGKKWKPSEHR